MAVWLIEIWFQCGCWASFPRRGFGLTDGRTDWRVIGRPFNKTPIIMHWASKSMSPLCVCAREGGRERGRVSKEEDSMIENCSGPSQMIPTVRPRTQTLSCRKRKSPFLLLNVGGRFATGSWASGEERCVFVFYAGLLLWKRSRSGEHTHSRWPLKPPGGPGTS